MTVDTPDKSEPDSEDLPLEVKIINKDKPVPDHEYEPELEEMYDNQAQRDEDFK